MAAPFQLGVETRKFFLGPAFEMIDPVGTDMGAARSERGESKETAGESAGRAAGKFPGQAVARFVSRWREVDQWLTADIPIFLPEEVIERHRRRQPDGPQALIDRRNRPGSAPVFRIDHSQVEEVRNASEF